VQVERAQQKYALVWQVDPNALAARGVGINDWSIRRVAKTPTSNLPTGTL